jgi:hypothetical protein
LILAAHLDSGHSQIPAKGEFVKKKRPQRGKSKMGGTDRRRKHRHWQVTVYYHDGERFARVYIDRDRAEAFAARQKKSPVVKAARITEVD